MPKVYDLIGNEIREGSLLFWKQLGDVVKVFQLDPGGEPDPENKKRLTPGRMLVGIAVPFEGHAATYLKDFAVVVDPAQQAALAGMIATAAVSEPRESQPDPDPIGNALQAQEAKA